MNTTLSQSAVRGITAAFSSGGWAEGTNANTIKTAATINYAIGGVLYAKSATDNIAVAAAVQAANSTCVYLICLDDAGAVSVIKGRDVLTAKLDNGDDRLSLPEIPAAALNTVCPVAALVLENAQTANATFTLGAVDLGASGITDTFYNLASLPAGIMP